MLKKIVKRLLQLTPYTLVRKKNSHKKTFSTANEYEKYKLFFEGVLIPPLSMRDKVRKGARMAEQFLLEGKQVFDELLLLLSDHGVSLDSTCHVYEFGCGCARVARYFKVFPQIIFYGSDIDDDLISWCKENIENYDFMVNSYEPPLDYSDNCFDLVYSISVFTHMTAETQRRWLKELCRVVKKEGLIVISILETTGSESGVLVKQRIDRDLERSWLGKNGNPDTYFSTYNTVEYIRNIASDMLEIIDVRVNAIRGIQTLIAFRPLKD